jgi:glycosyl hydrolase family 26
MSIATPALRPRAAAKLSIGLIAAALLLSTGMATSSAGAAPPGGRATASVKRAPAIHNKCAKSAIDVPSCGVLWGLFLPSQHYPTFEKSIGRRFDIIKNYTDWRPGTTFPNRVDARLANHGHRILDVSWNAVNYVTRDKVSYQSIAAGDWDKSVILPEARRLKHFHHKIFVDFQHEFDSAAEAGRGTPAQYVAAYRHIENVMTAAGVHNVIWTWVPTNFLPNHRTIKASYPGPHYVDWLGFDAYNWAQCHSGHWLSPYQEFHPFYRWLRHQPGMRRKPIMVGEYGSAPGAKIGAWYADVPSALRRMPDIKAVLQWDSRGSPTLCDFRLSDSPAAMAGFKVASLAPYVVGLGG